MIDSLTNYQLSILNSIKENKKLTKTEFSIAVERYVMETGEEYVASVVQLCELYDVDYESASKYLTDNLKQKIAKEQNLLSKVYNIDSELPL